MGQKISKQQMDYAEKRLAEFLRDLNQLRIQQEARDRFLDDLQVVMKHKILEDLDRWKEAVDSVIALAPIPQAQDSEVYWWIALAGNMIWAATSLMTDGAATVIMSFGGGALASGVLTPRPDNRAAGRDFVRKAVAQTRGQMEEHKALRSMARDWATEFMTNIYGKDMDASPEGIRKAQQKFGTSYDIDQMFDEFVWDHLFTVDANDTRKYTIIGDLALKNVIAALDYFNQEFKRWRQKGAQHHRNGTTYLSVEELEQKYPFKPDLGMAFGRPTMR